MGSIAKSRDYLSMLRHSYLNIMKLENCDPMGGDVYIIITKPHKRFFFMINFATLKGTKMADPILESSSKAE